MERVIPRLLACAFLVAGAAFASELKPRVVVLTDLKRYQETDDSQSLVRLLAHADLVEIEGIIVTSGANYWDPQHAIDGYAYVFELLQAYERSVGNLMKMSGQAGFQPVEDTQAIGYWPSPHYLVQRTALGTAMQGLDRTGPGKDNAGSRLLAAIGDEPDSRPVYVLLWGGGNVLAQTMRDLSENPATRRSPEAVAAFVQKLRVVAIGDQDQPWSRRRDPPVANNAGQWLRTTFPALAWTWIGPGVFTRESRDRQPYYQQHIQGHGALGDAYPDHSNAIEGDSPSLFHVLPLGLGDPKHPEWGTLAGLFVRGEHPLAHVQVFLDHPVGRDDVSPISERFASRAVTPMWHSLAARLDWARSGTGNRPPRVSVDGDASRAALLRDTAAGERVVLDASATRDGEQDKLTFAWEVLPVPGAFAGPLALEGASSARVSFTIPPELAGKSLHLLLSVTDDGAGHPLTSWKRVILRVRP